MIRPTQITLLGTGTSQGVPVIGCHCPVCTSPDPKDHRLRTAAFVQIGDIGLAIDIGPDFRQQMLNNRIQNVHAILLTHEHNDHVSGLDDIRPINFLYKRDMPIYGSSRTLKELEHRFYYAFDQQYQYPGKPKVHGVIIDDQPFEIEGIAIQPIQVAHGDMAIFGFRIGDLAYITDAKTLPKESMEALEGLDVLVLNALRIKPHEVHLNLDEALSVIEQLKPNRCFLTHISHHMGLQDEVNAMLPSNVRLGYDGLTIKLS